MKISLGNPIAKITAAVLVCTVLALASGCASSSPIQRYSGSESKFSDDPVLMKHEYPDKDVFRIYHRAATGFVSIQSVREAAEQRAEDFAKRQGKSFIVLGEKTSNPPYILGNFPRIEIVFALINKTPDTAQPAIVTDKYVAIERLKKLLDEGALTKEEFEREKAKVLQ